jgi:mannose-6-phosphate isomerase-like protein (cupin superfamily)
MSRTAVRAPAWKRRRPRASAPHPAREIGVDPYEIAGRLAPFLSWEEGSEVVERSWRLVARTPDFDAWLIAWPAGGRVELHDHGASRGVLTVLSGTLVETVPHRDEWGRLDLLRCDLQTGVTLRFDHGHVHDVLNEGPEPALSLHVYSPALTSMTHFEVVGDQLAAREVRYTHDGWEDESAPVLLHPAPALRLVAQ